MKVLRFLLPALLALLSLGLAAPAHASGTYVAPLSGDAEIPARDTLARGVAVIQVLDDAVHYRLIATNIDNVVAAHIHLGGDDVNGPVVAHLFGPGAPGAGVSTGVLATGTITADDLTGPLDGEPLSVLIDAIEAGEAYVNVHTNDGVAPTNTGPGDFPGGEIRGQLG
jgi:CHRD domain